jgi:hypothetical protein
VISTQDNDGRNCLELLKMLPAVLQDVDPRVVSIEEVACVEDHVDLFGPGDFSDLRKDVIVIGTPVKIVLGNSEMPV